MTVSHDLSFDRIRRLYEDGADRFTELVGQIEPKNWSAPTPCREWSVRHLVLHLTQEALWTPALLAGATIEDVGDQFDGDVLGKEPIRAWTGAITAARAAIGAPDADIERRTVHLSFGDTSAGDYVFQLATDLLIHGWDLARGIGADDELDPADVHLVHKLVNGMDFSGSGLFAPPVHVPADADEQTQLLALYGRARGPYDEPG
jgi:uncharacterized protein (TIGR03086 family)